MPHIYVSTFTLRLCVCLSKSACGAADTLPLLSPQTGRHGCSVYDQGGTHSFLWQPLGQRHRLQVWPSVCPFNEQLWLQVVWGPLVTSWSGSAPDNSLDIDLKSTVFQLCCYSLLYWQFGVSQQVGRTEKIQNCLSPKFAKKFLIDYYFEIVQKLKFGLYDIDNKTIDLSDDDFLGELECTLGQVRPSGMTCLRALCLTSIKEFSFSLFLQ